MDRVWLLTWTTYGTWLPGEDRGFVSNVDLGDGKGRRLNEVGSNPAAKIRGLQILSKNKMKGPPVYLTVDQAEVLFAQFRETAVFRNWSLLAVAIMANHVHLLVGVSGDPDPHRLLRDFKSYGSRCLTQFAGRPASGTWWTEGGSTRKKGSDEAIINATEYVSNQVYPLLIWRAGTASGGRKPPVSIVERLPDGTRFPVNPKDTRAQNPNRPCGGCV